MAIELSENDPIIKRAETIQSSVLHEVGFIPGDNKFGCKIYARRKDGELIIVALHSRIYGCNKDPYEIPVIIRSNHV